MAVRLKLRLKLVRTGKTHDIIALVNSGFETTTPQLLIPRKLAENLGVWPDMLPQAKIITYGTPGGIVRNYLIPQAIKVSVIEQDLEIQEELADITISEIEEEALISDKLAGKLGIILEDIGEGLYSLKADPKRTTRKTHPPQYW